MIYLAVVVMTLLGAIASISLKQSTLIPKKINKYFFLGGTLYFVSAIINVMVLRHLPYAIVLPMTSLTSIWTMGLAHLCFKEAITKRKVVGLVSIVIGVIVLVL